MRGQTKRDTEAKRVFTRFFVRKKKRVHLQTFRVASGSGTMPGLSLESLRQFTTYSGHWARLGRIAWTQRGIPAEIIRARKSCEQKFCFKNK